MSVPSLFFWFFTKHFIVDWLYQPPWMYRNKGTLFHLGGIAHSGGHALFSAAILAGFGVPILGYTLLACAEFLVHYFVDYTKMNINKKYEWGPTTSEHFWKLLGVDQYLHLLTYYFMIVYSLEYLK